MLRNITLKAAALPVLFFASLTLGCKSSVAAPITGAFSSSAEGNAASAAEELVGTWVFEKGDAGARYRITLELRADGTYTKTLETNVSVGGSHSGTWSNQGTVVYLSGDGNWPSSTHNLAQFHRIN